MLSPGNLGVSSFGTVAPGSALASWDVCGHFWFTGQHDLIPHHSGESQGLPTPTPLRPQLRCSLPLQAPATKGRSFSHSRGCKGVLTKSSSAPLSPAARSQTRRAGGLSCRAAREADAAAAALQQTQQDSLRQAAGKRKALLCGLPAVPTHIPSAQSPRGQVTGAAGGSPASGWLSSRWGDVPTKR